MQEELEANGSPRATIETDEERTYFLIDIPCHPYFTKKEIEIDTNGVKEDAESGVKDGVKDGVKSGVKGGVKELSDIQGVIVKEMLFDPSITTSEMAQKTGVKFCAIQGIRSNISMCFSVYIIFSNTVMQSSASTYNYAAKIRRNGRTAKRFARFFSASPLHG